jgi:hypothetical protein
MGLMPPVFLGMRKMGLRRREWNLFEGPLGKEGLHLLVYVVIVLALRGGAEVRPWQGKRWGGSEVGAETRHGFHGIWRAAEDVSTKRSEVLESTPHPLDCRRKGEAKRGNVEQPGSLWWHRIDWCPGLPHSSP